MCGNCERVSVDGTPVDRRLLQDSGLVRRGPGRDGIAVDHTLGLAARPLATIDFATGDDALLAEL